MILLVSKDKDFAAVASSLIAKELVCTCDSVESAEKLPLPSEYRLVVADGEKPNTPLPTLQLKKPCYLPDLLVEIDRKLQHPPLDKPIALCDQYLLFVQKKQLVEMATGKEISLTDKETGLLMHLYAAGEDGMERQALLEEVWGIEEGVPTRTLETHIYRLRAKIKTLKAAIELQDGKYRLAL